MYAVELWPISVVLVHGPVVFDVAVTSKHVLYDRSKSVITGKQLHCTHQTVQLVPDFDTCIYSATILLLIVSQARTCSLSCFCQLRLVNTERMNCRTVVLIMKA